MELEVSSPRSQKPATSPCPQRDNSSPRLPPSYLLKIYFVIILPSTPRSYKLSSSLYLCWYINPQSMQTLTKNKQCQFPGMLCTIYRWWSVLVNGITLLVVRRHLVTKKRTTQTAGQWAWFPHCLTNKIILSIWNWGSSVGISTGLRAGRSGFRVLAGARDFSFIQNAQTRYEAHPVRVPEYFSGG